MIHRTSQFLAAALLLSPLAVSARPAQHPAPAAAPAPAAMPAPAVAPADEAFPDNAVSDAGMWLDDEDLLAFGVDDEFYLESGDLDGGDADGPGDVGEAPGPGGEHFAPGALGGPGSGVMGHGFGMGHGPGMGLGQSMMMRRGWLGGRPMMRRGMPMMMRLQLAQLDLSDAQRDKLRGLHEANARRAIQRRADMALARMDLHKLMRTEKPDAGAVNAQIDKLTRLHADGLKAAFEMHMQARAVLTPEQIKQLHGPMAPMMHHDMMDAPDGRPKH